MTLRDLQKVLRLVEPYISDEHCLDASHDQLTIELAEAPPPDVTKQLRAIVGVALSWESEGYDGEGFDVICFT